uniref:Aminotransferase-like plant mobile domain-containing protein n=1 Tax=Phaseolus vulgaris TaxID=3885 RepID=V7CHT4_PHAVU|nr:hypothetical protein PHAVU_002G088800g [Phaseolus vulgaris]ESW29664.1 hypothetical protein PHAVU_002G088800g [Phaseolus vulgaris]
MASRRLPANMSLLRLQDKHVTKDVWEGNERLLRLRRHAIWVLKHEDILDQRVKQFIDHSSFGHLLKFKNIDFNHVLLTALVEMWRLETHTFQRALENKIRLEKKAQKLSNVHSKFDLISIREVVTGITTGDLVSLCEQFLIFLPPATSGKGNAINLSWLNNTFWELSHHATDDVIDQHARTHILTLGSLLMPDSSGSKVHLMYLLLLANLNNVRNYSWGSAVLASLYRALDHEIDFNQDNIGGCTLLLQCWAWERLTCISPQVQPLTDEEVQQGFLWTPYRVDYVRRLITIEVSPIARAVVPLICFATVEFHQVDRVMRQFGFRQSMLGLLVSKFKRGGVN